MSKFVFIIDTKKQSLTPLFGYKIREELLNKWERKCADCGIEDWVLQVEYIHPQPKRDSD